MTSSPRSPEQMDSCDSDAASHQRKLVRSPSVRRRVRRQLLRTSRPLWLRRRDLNVGACYWDARGVDPMVVGGLSRWLLIHRAPDVVSAALLVSQATNESVGQWTDCLSSRMLPAGYRRAAVRAVCLANGCGLLLVVFTADGLSAAHVAGSDQAGQGGAGVCAVALTLRCKRLLLAGFIGGSADIKAAAEAIPMPATDDGDLCSWMRAQVPSPEHVLDGYDYAVCGELRCAGAPPARFHAVPHGVSPPSAGRVLWRVRSADAPEDVLPSICNSVAAGPHCRHRLRDGGSGEASAALLRVAACAPRQAALRRAIEVCQPDTIAADAVAVQLLSSTPELADPEAMHALTAPAMPPQPLGFEDGAFGDEADDTGACSGDERAMLTAAEELLQGAAEGGRGQSIRQGEDSLLQLADHLDGDAGFGSSAPLEELELIGEGLTNVLERLCTVESRLARRAQRLGDSDDASEMRRLAEVLALLRSEGTDVARRVDSLSRNAAAAEMPAPLRDDDKFSDAERMRRCDLRTAYLAGWAAGSAVTSAAVAAADEPAGQDAPAASIAMEAAEATKEAAALLRREREASARADASNARARAAEERCAAAEERLAVARAGSESARLREEELAARELKMLEQLADISQRELQLKRERADIEQARGEVLSYCAAGGDEAPEEVWSAAVRPALSSSASPSPRRQAQLHPHATDSSPFRAPPHPAARRYDPSLPLHTPPVLELRRDVRPAWEGTDSSAGYSPRLAAGRRGRDDADESPRRPDAKLITPRSSLCLSAPASRGSSAGVGSVTSPRRRDHLAQALDRWATDPCMPPNFQRLGPAATSDCDDDDCAATYLYRFGTRSVAVRLHGRKEPRVLLSAGWVPFGDFVTRFGPSERKRMCR
eukprot:TRINITY_DN18722_c0_g1_i1.p1 TRINITY_DN18722_c0_g1~~TRINITY_DN18722_c0_g1_i1.p1  ORF type:complete len:903 (+),score=245.39 TRINITY_DN18722_c0_g1_i1:57-2711(+)